MTSLKGQIVSSGQVPAPGAEVVVGYLRQAIAAGRHWYPALLEAVAMWTAAEETSNGRTYRYLVSGEAFDWLLLAERLCDAVDGLLPEAEKDALIFAGRPPLKLTADSFRGLIGEAKYHQYLNYFYGVTVEEALFQVTQEEVRKERWAAGYGQDEDQINEVFRRVYGTTRAVLLRRFRREKGYPQLKSISFAELKEFTYWRFKYRLACCDKAKVASDTKKALDWLKSGGFPFLGAEESA